MESLAYAALLVVLPLSAVAFISMRPPLAVALLFIASAMFLPEAVAVDLPGLPPFDKTTIPGLCALLGALATSFGLLVRARPLRGIESFAWLLLLGTIGTALTNKDGLVFGSTYLRGLVVYDAVSDSVRLFLSVVMPFFLGRALFRTQRDLEDLLKLLALAGLVYLPFILIELRLSPQFHRWVYGFHQHEFQQTLRGGGYRPMVFMAHGLALAMFMFACVVAAFGLAKVKRGVLGLPGYVVAMILLLVLVTCKSLGALVYAICCLPLMWIASSRWQARVAGLLVLMVLAYPALRSANAFPTKDLVELSARAGQDRAESLKFRFDNEDSLIVKAQQRLWFGWGGFGRNRVYDEDGRDISVVDGAWIGVLGSNGIFGFVGTFGLLMAPILLARRKLRRIQEVRSRVMLGALTLIVAFNALDLLPNGLFSALPLFLSGALAGLISGLASESVGAGAIQQQQARARERARRSAFV